MIGRFFGWATDQLDGLIDRVAPATNDAALLAEAEAERDAYEPLISAVPEAAAGSPEPGILPLVPPGSGQPIRTTSDLCKSAADVIWCLSLDEDEDTAESFTDLIHQLRDRAANLAAHGD